ncbi:MAG: hypothetical protein WAN36_08320, partial [Calditrichia bacterium]
MAEKSWIDNMISDLEGKPGQNKKELEKLLKWLNADREDAEKLIAQLKAESAHLVYPHLQKGVEEVVSSQRNHINSLGRMIKDLGGSDPAEPGDYRRSATGNFQLALNMMFGLQEEYNDQAII